MFGIHAPVEGHVGSIPNLGFVPMLNAELRNGAAIGTGLVEGGASVLLDAANDFVDMNWPTLTNLAPDPFGAHTGDTKYWSLLNAGITIGSAERTYPAVLGGKKGKVIRFTADGTINEQGGDINNGLSAQGAFQVGELQTHAAAIWVWVPSGMELNAGINERTDADGFVGNTYKKIVGNNDWNFVAVNRTFAAGSKKTHVRFQTANKAAGAFDVLVPQLEPNRSTAITEAESGPRPAQLEAWSTTNPEGELAGWSGVADGSASDIGPFARGVKRIFMGIAMRSVNNTACIFSSVSGVGPALQFGVGGFLNLYMVPPTVAASWAAGTLPPLGAIFTWALKIDQLAATAELFMNGVSKGSKALGANKSFASVSQPNDLILGAYQGGSQFLGGALLPSAVGPSLTAAEISAFNNWPLVGAGSRKAVVS